MVAALIDYEIVSVWIPFLIYRLRIVPFDLRLIVLSFHLISIANKITGSGSGVDRSKDCIYVLFCFVEQVEDCHL